ncbi:MAG: DUF402 domain-containing protein [Actinomycetota bacterium]
MARKTGDPIVLREIWKDRIWAARPVTVVEDAPEVKMFYVHAGMRWKSPASPNGEWLRLPAGDWILADRVSTKRRALSFAWSDLDYAVLANWDANSNEFLGWYINLQTTLRRTAVGFDYVDHVLDVVVTPDRSSWEWKDEDEFSEAQELGLISPGEARAIRDEGERAIERLTSHAPPFDRPWEDWQPSPDWNKPELLPGWDKHEVSRDEAPRRSG